MRQFLRLTTMGFACCLAVACSRTAATEPCDVLVPINPAPATNTFLITNDRPAAIAIAQHRGRYQNFGCGK